MLPATTVICSALRPFILPSAVAEKSTSSARSPNEPGNGHRAPGEPGRFFNSRVKFTALLKQSQGRRLVAFVRNFCGRGEVGGEYRANAGSGTARAGRTRRLWPKPERFFTGVPQQGGPAGCSPCVPRCGPGVRCFSGARSCWLAMPRSKRECPRRISGTGTIPEPWSGKAKPAGFWYSAPELGGMHLPSPASPGGWIRRGRREKRNTLDPSMPDEEVHSPTAPPFGGLNGQQVLVRPVKISILSGADEKDTKQFSTRKLLTNRPDLPKLTCGAGVLVRSCRCLSVFLFGD